MDKTPVVGDKRFRGICDICGSNMYDIYKSFNGYHNEVYYEWESDGHVSYKTLMHCVKVLATRIKELEAIEGKERE